MIYGIVLLNIIATLKGYMHMAESMEIMILYLWSRRNKEMIVSIMGFIPVRAPYLTWIFIGISYLFG